MFKKSTYLGICGAILVGVLLFKVKYEVVALAGSLNKVQHEILRVEESIHLLQAEWAYLTQPSRIQKLADEHLQLTPTKTDQILRDDKIVKCLYDLGQDTTSSEINHEEQLILTSGER